MLGKKKKFHRVLGKIICFVSVLTLWPVSAFGDSVYIDMERVDPGYVGTPLGAIWAVDSWFLTLVTLNFKLSDVPDGSYQVRLHETPNCENPGSVYNPDGDEIGERIGDLLPEMLAENGTLTGIHGIKPPVHTADAHKLTVIEMRGHSLLLQSNNDDAIVACGVVREGEWEEPR